MSEATAAKLKELQQKEMPASYQKRLAGDEVRYLKTTLHPTNRSESKEVTRRLLEYLNDRDIVTCQDIQRDLDLSETPVLKRLKVLREFKLLKRELNRYYMPTPRLKEFVRLYLKGM